MRKSIVEQSKNIWTGPTASLIASKKSNFKKQLCHNTKEKHLKFILRKIVGFNLANTFNISILELTFFTFTSLYVSSHSAACDIILQVPFFFFNFIVEDKSALKKYGFNLRGSLPRNDLPTSLLSFPFHNWFQTEISNL